MTDNHKKTVIDKASGVPVEYHYNRESRLKNASEMVKDGIPKSFFSNNRGLFIILLDIIIIVVLFNVFSLFNEDKSIDTLHGTRFHLQVMEFDKQLFVSLSVKAENKTGKSPARIQSGVLKTEGAERTIFTQAELPVKEDERRIYRAESLEMEYKETAYLQLEIIDSSGTASTLNLKARVRAE